MPARRHGMRGVLLAASIVTIFVTSFIRDRSERFLRATGVGLSQAAAALFLLGAFASGSAAAGIDDLIQQRSGLNEAYAKQHEELGRWCDSHGLTAEAKRTRAWPIARDPGRLYVFDVRGEEAERNTLENDAEPVRQWRKKWKALRDAQADALLQLARSAVKQKAASLAFELVREAVRENPEQETARKILGYIKHQARWRTPFEMRQLRLGKLQHPKYGWLPKPQLEKYERGERFYSGRWMSAEQEAKLRSSIRSGWEIESDHYLVTTNSSLEAGVELAGKLERFYEVWQQVFVRYLASEAELARAFQSRTSPIKETAKHKVVYYQSRDEYNSALRPMQQRIAKTLGYYSGNTQTAYFFAGPDQEQGTLYHEATHQLFQECRPVVHDVGRKSNFWILEGVACYFESLTPHAGYLTLGGFDAGRLPAARHRLMVDRYYLPLGELTTLGMDEVQAREDIVPLYSQAAGQAMFLIHAEGGKYRDALVQYLVSIYSGQATPSTLSDLTGKSYETLDAEYREFLKTASAETGASGH